MRFCHWILESVKRRHRQATLRQECRQFVPYKEDTNSYVDFEKTNNKTTKTTKTPEESATARRSTGPFEKSHNMGQKSKNRYKSLFNALSAFHYAKINELLLIVWLLNRFNLHLLLLITIRLFL